MKTTLSGFDLLRRTREQSPEFLAQEIMRAMGAGGVQWRDPPDATQPWRNLCFLRPGGRIPLSWPQVWPEDEHPILWDAIGRVQMGRVGWSWLMVTALSHPYELDPQPAPAPIAADHRIRDAVAAAQERFHATGVPSWLDTHYPMSMHLVAFAHQRSFNSCARFLTVHFYRETPEAWDHAITQFNARMGLTGKSVAERNVYRMFLPMPEEA